MQINWKWGKCNILERWLTTLERMVWAEAWICVVFCWHYSHALIRQSHESLQLCVGFHCGNSRSRGRSSNSLCKDVEYLFWISIISGVITIVIVRGFHHRHVVLSLSRCRVEGIMLEENNLNNLMDVFCFYSSRSSSSENCIILGNELGTISESNYQRRVWGWKYSF